MAACMSIYVYTHVLGLGKCAQTACVHLHVIACRHAPMLECAHLCECVWDFADVFVQSVRGLW